MKLNRQDLKQALDKISIVKPSKILDITSYSLLELANGQLKITSNNIQTALSYTVDVGLTGVDANYLLPTEKLTKLVNTLANDEVELKLTTNDRLQVKQGKLKTTMAINPDVDLFPAEDGIQESFNELGVNSQTLRKRLLQAIFSASDNEAIPIHQGVNWLNGGMVATNGYRVSFVGEWIYSTEADTIPAVALQQLVKLLPDEDVAVSVAYDSNKVWFKFENMIFSCVLLAGDYPDVSSYYNTNFEYGMKLNTSKVKELLRQALIFAEDVDGGVVKVTVGEGLTVESVTSVNEYLNELEAVESNYAEPCSFGISCFYFKQAVDNIEQDEFELKVDAETPNSPIVILAGDFKHIIMPMYLTK